jgi:hypothetical protein
MLQAKRRSDTTIYLAIPFSALWIIFLAFTVTAISQTITFSTPWQRMAACLVFSAAQIARSQASTTNT